MACTRCGQKIIPKPTGSTQQPVAGTPNNTAAQERSGWKPR
ncbi:MAG TPA: hypothetical protein VIH30_03570 [Aquirhabdus sp.]